MYGGRVGNASKEYRSCVNKWNGSARDSKGREKAEADGVEGGGFSNATEPY